MRAAGILGTLFLFALAIGILLSLAGIAGTSMRVQCKTGCLDDEQNAQMALEDCMDQCQEEMKEVIGGVDCSLQCALQREPLTDRERIKASYKRCKRACQPSDLAVRVVYLGGTTSVLCTLGMVLTHICSCGDFVGVFGLELDALAPQPPPRQAQGGANGCACLRTYALAFYALSLVLFFRVTFQDMRDEVGVKIVCILSAMTSLSFQGLDELRRVIQRFDVPYSEVARLMRNPEQPKDVADPQTVGSVSWA